jgi:hypothetical protein
MKVLFRVHAIERMFERGIAVDEIQAAVLRGEDIEKYNDSSGYPASLKLAGKGRRAIHVVVAETPEERIVVTGYRPDRARWTEDFRRRRDDMPDL